MFPLPRHRLRVLRKAMCGVSSAPCGAAQPLERSELTVGCMGPSGAAVPSLAWEGAVVSPPAQSGAWLRLAAGAADVLEAEVMLTSICYKLGGKSHAVSPQILQCRSPQPCSAAVINSVTPRALSCCRSRLSPASPLSSLPIAGEKAAHVQLPASTYVCTAALPP